MFSRRPASPRQPLRSPSYPRALSLGAIALIAAACGGTAVESSEPGASAGGSDQDAKAQQAGNGGSGAAGGWGSGGGGAGAPWPEAGVANGGSGGNGGSGAAGGWGSGGGGAGSPWPEAGVAYGGSGGGEPAGEDPGPWDAMVEPDADTIDAEAGEPMEQGVAPGPFEDGGS